MRKTLFFLIASLSAQAADTAPYAKIDRIEGAKQIKVKRGKKTQLLSVGATLKPGDSIETNEKTKAVIEAGQDTKLYIEEKSNLEVTQNSTSDRAIKLLRGKLVGWVKKATAETTEANRKKYPFSVETKSAVMGVRGTKFSVESAEGEKSGTSSFRVFEGVVDVASSVKELLTENVIVVKAGELVSIATDHAEKLAENTKSTVLTVTDTVDSGVSRFSKAMPFDLREFAANMNDKLPTAFQIPLLAASDPVTAEENSVVENTEDAEKTDTPPPKRYSLFHLSAFEFYSEGFFNGEVTPYTPAHLGLGLSWNPTIHLAHNKTDLRFHLGNARLFKKGRSPFDELEFKVSISTIQKNIYYAEIGPLAQRFYTHQWAYGIAATSGLWFGDKKIIRLFDRIFFGVNWLRTNSIFTNTPNLWEFRFGLGLIIFRESS